MKNIEIRTSNNVAIQYELATVGQRILASLLDFLIIFGYSLICSLVSIVFTFNLESSGDAIYWIMLFPVVTFYNLVSEIYFDGQTLGKKILKLRVIKVNGELPTVNDYFLRWTYRIVDIYISFGALAAIFIASSDKSQRLGDLSANTTIIKLEPETQYGIKDILKIGVKKDYEPTYLNVTLLSDEDMLLIKNTIDRVQRLPNKANKQFARELIDKTRKLLGIDNRPKHGIKFLKTLLKDYIILTR